MADEVLLDPRCVLIADGDGLDGAEVGEKELSASPGVRRLSFVRLLLDMTPG